MRLRTVVFSISQNRIVNSNYEIETDNLPIQGLDPDLRVYGAHTPYVEPPIDTRGYILQTTETLKNEPHPVYPSLLLCEITYQALRKTNAELKEAVDNARNIANETLMPAISSASDRTIAINLLSKKSKASKLTSEQEKFLDGFNGYSDAMLSNRLNAESMYEYIDNNPTLVPNIDQGWTTSIT